MFQRNSEFPDAAADFRSVHRGKPELEPLPRHASPAVAAERDGFHVPLRRGPGGRRRVDPLPQSSGGLQPRFDIRDLQQSLKPLFRLLEKDGQSFPVHLAHPPEVAAEISPGNEIREHGLFNQRVRLLH